MAEFLQLYLSRLRSPLNVRNALLAGFVASVTGTAATIGVVLASLTALGATKAQTAPAVFVMLVSYGVLGQAPALHSWLRLEHCILASV